MNRMAAFGKNEWMICFANGMIRMVGWMDGWTDGKGRSRKADSAVDDYQFSVACRGLER
jgi:hypothetical protein